MGFVWVEQGEKIGLERWLSAYRAEKDEEPFPKAAGFQRESGPGGPHSPTWSRLSPSLRSPQQLPSPSILTCADTVLFQRTFAHTVSLDLSNNSYL